MLYLLWRHNSPTAEKKFMLVEHFFSWANEVKIYGLVQQLILGRQPFLMEHAFVHGNLTCLEEVNVILIPPFKHRINGNINQKHCDSFNYITNRQIFYYFFHFRHHQCHPNYLKSLLKRFTFLSSLIPFISLNPAMLLERSLRNCLISKNLWKFRLSLFWNNWPLSKFIFGNNKTITSVCTLTYHKNILHATVTHLFSMQHKARVNFFLIGF